MEAAAVLKFKGLFEKQKNEILFNDKVIREDFLVSEEDKFDEVDQASADVDQQMRMRLRNRELLYLKKLDIALQRIEEGNFGDCDCCGEQIETRRLEARPTATLCVSCKEEEERREVGSIYGRRSKSMGDHYSELR